MSNDFKLHFYENGNLINKIAFTGKNSSSVIVGKNDADIKFNSSSVSRTHAQIIYDGKDVFIQDLNSTNGTFINKNKLTPNVTQHIRVGDTIFFSNSGAVYMQCLNVAVSASRETNFSSSVPPLSSFFNQKNEISIGRGDNCDVVLSHSSISRQHASIVKLNNNQYKIFDKGSTNGTFVNGKKVRSAIIGPGDVIYIGRFLLSLDNKARNLNNESAITAENVTKIYHNGFHALKETSFDIPSASLIAIMGPSGCGKSTLLKVLNGDSPATYGNVRILGLDLIENYGYLKTQIGYVPQDDIVHRELTVEQSLYYAAKLRLDGISEEEALEKVNNLLTDLNICEIRNNLVSKISGGQRKRVSIAVELLSDPAVLFLDEPTSPLDPQTIEEFLGILKKLSERGTTVVMVTHKPEDLNYMDSVIFMAEGGIMVFYGDKDKYQSFFNVTSPVQVYASISGENAKKWVNHRLNSNKISSPRPNNQNKIDQPVDPFRQLFWLMSRYFKIKTNDQLNSIIMIAQAPIIAILICVIFDQISLSVPFLLAISGIWFGVNNAAREIVSESAIFKRERMFNLLLLPYIFSKVIVLGIFAFIQAVLFNLIIWAYFQGGNSLNWNDPIMGIIWMFFITVSSSMFGLLISSSSESGEKVMSFVPIAIIPQIMLAGAIAEIKNSGIEFLSYFTFSRWGTEGFCNLQKDVIVKQTIVNNSPDANSESAANLSNNTEPIQKEIQTSAVDALGNNFDSSYKTTFGDLASTIELDSVMMLVLFFICLSIIFFTLKKRDSI